MAARFGVVRRRICRVFYVAGFWTVFFARVDGAYARLCRRVQSVVRRHVFGFALVVFSYGFYGAGTVQVLDCLFDRVTVSFEGTVDGIVRHLALPFVGSYPCPVRGRETAPSVLCNLDRVGRHFLHVAFRFVRSSFVVSPECLGGVLYLKMCVLREPVLCFTPGLKIGCVLLEVGRVGTTTVSGIYGKGSFGAERRFLRVLTWLDSSVFTPSFLGFRFGCVLSGLPVGSRLLNVGLCHYFCLTSAVAGDGLFGPLFMVFV